MTINKKPYLTSREAAEILGVALSTIQIWTQKGQLDAWLTEGGHRRIKRTSVDRMLHKRLAATGEAEDEYPCILVVEDCPKQQSLYRQQFTARGFANKLVIASNGFEGLIQIGHHKPDVIITDLKMPFMDGFQMVRALKNNSECDNSLTIVVSSYDKDEIKQQGGLPSGVHLYAKPIPFDAIEKLICKSYSTIRQEA